MPGWTVARAFSPALCSCSLAAATSARELLANVVDGVLLRLTERVETSALVQLSTALAELEVAPPETLRRLASHDNPDVACPVLLKSQALSTADLAASLPPAASGINARSRPADCIEPAVTEALIKRGEPDLPCPDQEPRNKILRGSLCQR